MGGGLGRKALEAGESFQLKEDQNLYIADFEAKKSDIGVQNAYVWDQNFKMKRLSLARPRRPDPGGKISANTSLEWSARKMRLRG